jgi:multidrug resistance efflux pump
VTASVRVVPARVAELSFVIAAPVRAVMAAEGQALTAGQTILVLDAPQLEYAVKAADAALTSATADESIQSQGRRKWNGFKFVWVAGPPEQRQVAHARVLQAHAGLDLAWARQAQSILVAPFEGTLTSVRVSGGEMVQPGQTVAVVADLAHMRIETTDLSERDLPRVKIGADARITLEALRRELRGSVTSIEPLAARSEDGDVIYKVIIDLQHSPAELLWGMTGEALIDSK